MPTREELLREIEEIIDRAADKLVDLHVVYSRDLIDFLTDLLAAIRRLYLILREEV